MTGAWHEPNEGGSTMADTDLTIDQVRRMAESIGMTGLNEAQWQELLRATRATQGRRAALSTAGLTLADEPAHVFSLLGQDLP